MSNMKRLYIVEPTLETILSSLGNDKALALDAGIDYSGFVKNIKLHKNITFSTYLKCAEAMDHTVVVMHVPTEIVESVGQPKCSIGDYHCVIGLDVLLKVLEEAYDPKRKEILQELAETLASMVGTKKLVDNLEMIVAFLKGVESSIEGIDESGRTKLCK